MSIFVYGKKSILLYLHAFYLFKNVPFIIHFLLNCSYSQDKCLRIYFFTMMWHWVQFWKFLHSIISQKYTFLKLNVKILHLIFVFHILVKFCATFHGKQWTMKRKYKEKLWLIVSFCKNYLWLDFFWIT